MLPATIRPMLAQTAPAPFDSDDYGFEVKWDGIRCLAFIERRGVRLHSRALLDITAQFPELACLAALPVGTVLDGELVVLRDGRPSLSQIARRVQLRHPGRIRFLGQAAPVLYLVFDLLYCQGTSVMATPLTTRRAQLESLVTPAGLPQVMAPDRLSRYGCALFEQVVALGLEGLMAKRNDSPYRMGKRSRAWLKIKPKRPFLGEHLKHAANHPSAAMPVGPGAWVSSGQVL
jgi:ATP-dependent DNA ligase